MKLHRTEPGIYLSADRRVRIVRESGESFNGRRHVKFTVWTLFLDGKRVGMDHATKAEAVAAAGRKLAAGGP